MTPDTARTRHATDGVRAAQRTLDATPDPLAGLVRPVFTRPPAPEWWAADYVEFPELRLPMPYPSGERAG